MAPHLLDQEPLLATIAKRDADFGWDDFLGGSKRARAAAVKDAAANAAAPAEPAQSVLDPGD
jgi:hypothetical protein